MNELIYIFLSCGLVNPWLQIEKAHYIEHNVMIIYYGIFNSKFCLQMSVLLILCLD